MMILHPRQYRRLQEEAVLAIGIGERAYLADDARAAVAILWPYVSPQQWIEKYGW